MARHVLYRFYSATGQLLYVGITMDPASRFKSHRGKKDWWADVAGISIEDYASREDLANAERRAIRVERPLHNIVHAKVGDARPKTAGKPEAPPTQPPTIPASDPFSSLFGREVRRDTCFGYVTATERKQLAEIERAKWAARAECTLCDSDGYRGRVVCDHVDRSGRARAAQRAVQKNQLQIIQGGGV